MPTDPATAMWAMHLHATGGLTLPRLKEMCVASGMRSQGRARSLLLYFHHLGYIDVLPKTARGESTRYVPTATFVEAWRDHLKAALEAARVIDPAVGSVIARLNEPHILDSIIRVQGADWHATMRQATRNTPFMRVVMHRHGGNQIVWMLIASSEGDAFPPERTVPLSTSELARRFHVSRPHIRRLFESAAGEGLMQLTDNGIVMFSEEMRTTLKYFFAAQLARLLISAASAAASEGTG